MRIVVTHMGGLGDLVLFRECYDSLRSAYCSAEITIVCRSSSAGIFSLYETPPDRIIPLEFNPYLWTEPGGDLRAQLQSELAKLPARPHDLFLSPELKPTWLSWVIAAHLRPNRSIIASAVHAVPSLAREVLAELELPPAHIEYFTQKGEQPELARYRELLGLLEVAPAAPPEWRIPETALSAAGDLLQAHGLEPKHFIACFPSSAAATRFRRWPADCFVELLTNVQHNSMGILLVGDVHEAGDLSAVRSKLKERGVQAALFTGSPGDLPVVAALLMNARAYAGNDTGLPHLAAAFGTPGLTLYGGGTWPMYAPWRDGMVGIVNPLPCFSCFWDCTFDRGICVESISLEAATAALKGILAQSKSSPSRIVESHAVPAGEQRIIAEATRVYRRAQEDRRAARDRAAVIAELQRALVDRDRHAKQLQDAAEQREKQIHDLGTAITERDMRLGALTSQVRDLSELRAALEETDRRTKTLQEAADLRAQKVDELAKALEKQVQSARALEADAKNFQELLATAQERERIIFELNTALNEREKNAQKVLLVAAEREALIVELSAAVEDRERRIAQLERVAEERLIALKETDEGLRAVTAEADRRAMMLAEVTSHLRERTDRA